MVKYVIKRILLMLLTLFIILTFCLVLIKLLPLPTPMGIALGLGYRRKYISHSRCLGGYRKSIARDDGGQFIFFDIQYTDRTRFGYMGCYKKK